MYGGRAGLVYEVGICVLLLLNPVYMGYNFITPKNEGCGFPWYSVNRFTEHAPCSPYVFLFHLPESRCIESPRTVKQPSVPMVTGSYIERLFATKSYL